MRNILAIAKKELAIYLTTPWAWVVFTGMSFISSLFFLASLLTFQQVQEMARRAPHGWAQLPSDYQIFRNLTDGVVLNLFNVVLVIILFAAPFLSMRLIAEERRQKTFELLMTTPTRAIEIVLGKYVGAVGIIILTLSVTLVFPFILAIVGNSASGTAIEWSTVWLGYFALTLWGATCMAVGLFISSLTESQMVAAVLTFAVSMGWMLIRTVTPNAEEPVKSILSYLSFDTQLQNLLKGVMDLKPVVYFSSVIAFFLLLTHRSLEARRWS